MKIEQQVLDANGFKDFNPMQKAAIQKGCLEKNLVISSPTASGKTVVAELAALHSILQRKRKVVYTCPLRALANEHYNDFKKKYAKQLNIKATISTGDFDSSSSYLQNYDIIFTTYEKLDSLIRHRTDWLSSIGLLVIDEIHELDSDRGPTLEMLITKLRMMAPKMQMLALSATIPNAKELAKWLHSELVVHDYRPVKLKEGVYFDGAIKFDDKDSSEIFSSKDAIPALIEDTLQKGKQALIFANTRKRSESIAKQLAKMVSEKLSPNEKKHLEVFAKKAMNVLESPTEQCKTLSQLIRQGVAFHNAALLSRQREIVEELFKENYLKIISATPTLAAGVNLPAYRVIIPSVYRYSAYGLQPISVREFKQWCGRAGRPKYDNEGQAILLAKNEFEADDLFENFINGEIEPVESKLGYESVLRTHLLAAIAGKFVFDLESLEAFFGKTFYALQFGNMADFFAKVNLLLAELEQMGFTQSDNKRIVATPLGNRVSELYLDPLSAHQIIAALNQNKSNDLAYLFCLANTTELMPYVNPGKGRQAEIWEQLEASADLLPINVHRDMYTDEHLVAKFNTAQLLKEWIEEVTEESLLKKFNAQPGLLYSRLRICDWLSYCTFEISKLLHLEHHFAPLTKMRKRLKHGVREELIHLTELRYIGRVRARRLWRANVRTIADLKKIPISDLSRILSPKIAVKVKGQLGQKEKTEKSAERIGELAEEETQKSLENF